MKRFITVAGVALLLLGLVAPTARATHFDGVAATGTFDPQFTATIGENRASRAGDINFHLTAADHEDPPVVTTFRTPGDWSYTFEFIRRGQKSNGAPVDGSLSSQCNQTINNRGNSPDRTGQPGGPMDFSKRTDAFIARSEIIASLFLAAHADTVSRPQTPITFRGNVSFISYNAATKTANLCLLLVLIVDPDDADYSPSNENAKKFADPVPGSGSDEVEGVTELTTGFQLKNIGTDWETIVDLTDLVKEEALQVLQVSIVDFKANFFGMTAGNCKVHVSCPHWNTEGSIPFARAPGTSGTKTFSAIFKTCPQNDSTYLNCKSDKGAGSSAMTGGTVTRTTNVTITPAPGINVPLNGASCTDSVQVLGAADPGTEVSVTEGLTTLANETADANGRWEFRQAFLPGPHTIQAHQISPPGPDSEAVSFTVALPAPAITGPLAGSIHEPGTVTISGTSPAGTRTAKVYVDNGATQTLVGSGPADDAGNWTANVTLPPHTTPTLKATATNLCGEGALSPGHSIVVTSTRPTFTSPASGAALNTSSFNVNGNADPGATVTVYEAGSPVGSGTADGSGAWSAPVTLAEGTHGLSADALVDTYQSSLTTGYSIEVDLTAPNVPVITSPADGARLEPSVRVTGTSEPASTVVILEGATELGRTTAAADGSFAKTVVFELGDHSFVTKAIDRATNESALSAPIALVIIDPTKINSPAEGGFYPKAVPFDLEASPNAKKIVIFESDAQIFEAFLQNGKWKGPVQMSAGQHVIIVRSKAADGTLGDPTEPRTFVVDAAGPTLVITAPQPVILASQPIAGTATDNAALDSGVASVKIVYSPVQGGSALTQVATCTGCTGASVSFTAIPSSALPRAGVYKAVVTAYDAVGNASASQTIYVIGG